MHSACQLTLLCVVLCVGSSEALAAAPSPRDVAVEMRDDFRFAPATLAVKKGETIRLVLHNQGALAHEMVLGSARELDEHAAMMRMHPTMVHADANALRVAPGQSGVLRHRFTRSGTVHFACLVPGHREAGMVGQVEVR